MYERSNRDKIVQLMFLLLLFGLSVITCSSDASCEETESFYQMSPATVSIPVKIAPVIINAPARHVDLLPDRINKKVRGDGGSNINSVSIPLTFVPVDLFEFPLLKFSIADQDIGLYGLELSLDTRGKGAFDTLVRLGDPALFPDMLNKQIDFRSVEFVARDLGYRIKGALGIDGDEKWRYTPINCKVNVITDGIISASLNPRGSIFFHKSFGSLKLSKTPWVRFEYELPEGLPWIVQINAKIDRGSLNPRLTTLFSDPVEGSGKQKLTLNLLELLQKTDSTAKEGRLEELIINFKLDTTAEIAQQEQEVHIGLVRLDLYNSQMLTGAVGPTIFLVGEVGDVNVNLHEALKKRFPLQNNWTVLEGRLIGARQDFASITENLPEVSLVAEYREKMPELLVGERFLLDELSGEELNSVLDHKFFFQKHLLWESGQSDVIFRNSNAPMLPLLSFSPEKILGDVNYISADFLFEDGKQYPLHLTLLGNDLSGRSVKQNYQLLTNSPTKIKSIRIIKKATLSFSQDDGAALPFPASCLIRNIQISSFVKTASYVSQPAIAYAALVPSDTPVWRTDPAGFDISVSGGLDIQTIKSFPVDAKMSGDAVLKYKLETVAGESLKYQLRVRAIDGGKLVEKMFPLYQRGKVPVSNLYLLSLDVVFRKGAQRADLPVSLLLKQFEIEDRIEDRIEGATGQNKLLRRKPSGLADITYLAPHKSLSAPTLAWLRPAYATEIDQPTLETMQMFDATLTYDQILWGGKNAVLPKKLLSQGKHVLHSVGDEGVRVNIAPSFLEVNRVQRAQTTAKDAFGKPGRSKLAKIGLLLLMAASLLLVVKTKPRWQPLVDRTLALETVFWGLQFVLLDAALYLIFSGVGIDTFSYGGLLLALSYGIAVRYRLRSYLASRWILFSDRPSAPYYLFFFALLLSCMLLLTLKLDKAAEHTAVLGYYLLVTGVVIEFICFAKEARLDAPSSG